MQTPHPFPINELPKTFAAK